MSFLVGKNQQMPNVNGATSGLDQSLINYIQGQGFAGLNPGTQVDSASIAPYQKMFADQNAQAFGQAKESAGGLTGSGLGESLGRAAGQAANQQGGFLAQLFENRRQQDASRFLQLVLGTLGSPAGGVTNAYQPGLLDYASQGAAAAASLLAPGAGGAIKNATPQGGPGGGPQGGAGNYTNGQVGQSGRYNFDGSHTLRPNSGIGDPLGGYFDPTRRDSFGNPE